MLRNFHMIILCLTALIFSLNVFSQQPEAKEEPGGFSRSDISFTSQGQQCRGWLYVPTGTGQSQNMPAIVTANAILATKEMILPAYAERFAAAGFVTLVFDYRSFGSSDGEPKHHLVPYEMLQDIKNAITWLAEQPEVDQNRIGGFGISLGGGHMLHLAAFERRLKAVVATASRISGTADFEYNNARKALQEKLLMVTRDRIDRAKSGSLATYRKAFGSTGGKSLLPEEEVYDYYAFINRTVSSDLGNMLTVQSLENLLEYNPTWAIHLASPTAVLFIHSEKDFIPVSLIYEVYGRTQEPKKITVFECSHTNFYDDELWISNAADEAVTWFRKHLTAKK